jgi:hypothetical protein
MINGQPVINVILSASKSYTLFITLAVVITVVIKAVFMTTRQYPGTKQANL